MWDYRFINWWKQGPCKKVFSQYNKRKRRWKIKCVIAYNYWLLSYKKKIQSCCFGTSNQQANKLSAQVKYWKLFNTSPYCLCVVLDNKMTVHSFMHTICQHNRLDWAPRSHQMQCRIFHFLFNFVQLSLDFLTK